MKKFLFLISFTLLSSVIFAQTTIYSEDFTGQEGKGAVGPGPTTDLSGVTWSIDVSSVSLTATSDWFQVLNGVFEGRDLDGNAFWLSPSIDISGQANVEFTIDASETGGHEGTDQIETEYRIDGGAWTPTDINTILSGVFGSAIISQTGLNGSTLEIRVRMDNDAGAEFLRIDNVLVQAPATTPIVGFDNAIDTQDETDATFNISIPVTFANYDGTPVDLNVTVTGGTAEAGDYTLNTTTLSFTSDGTQNISLDINDDVDEEDETLELTITETTATGVTVSQATHTLTIIDDDVTLPQILITEITDPSDDAGERMVEICNRGTGSVDITGWRIQGDFNGNTNRDFTVNVSGSVTLNAGDCYAFVNSGFTSDLSSCSGSTVSGNINSNGNETFWLNDGSMDIDIYDGTALNFGDSRVTRNTGITEPTPTFNASEWTVQSAVTADITPCNDTPIVLPVELADLKVEQENKTAKITWQTRSEINNDYFVIERSNDSRTFQEIGMVQGAGTSDATTTYRFEDNNTLKGTNYYRLRQVDFDGSVNYSHVVSVRFGSTESLSIYPNPTSADIMISFAEELQQEANAEILSQNGNVLKSIKLSSDTINQLVTVSDLPTGIYFLRLIEGEKVSLVKFMKK